MVELLTPEELRGTLKISRSTLARLVAEGLPSIGSGRLRRFEWEVVLPWLDCRPTTTRTAPMVQPGRYRCRGCGHEGALLEAERADEMSCPRCGRLDPERIGSLR